MAVLISVAVDEGTSREFDLLAKQSGLAVEELHRRAVTTFVRDESDHVEALLEGQREVEANYVVSQDEVERWVASLRSGNPLPRPRPVTLKEQPDL